LLGEQRLVWRPNRDTLVALVSYGLVVAGLYTAFQVFTTERVAANFIAFGPITLAGLGVALPVLFTVLVRRRSLADVGLTTRHLLPSLILGLLLGWDTYRNTLATLDVVWSREVLPLVVMALAVGLFEAIFFRGWLQLRFEEAFGVVPAVVLGALCYSLYHVGYGMDWNEMLFLFGLGLVFAAVFRLTRNVAVLWPFYTPIGGLYTNLTDGLTMPFEATYGFLLTLGLMLAAIVTGMLVRWRRLQVLRSSIETPVHFTSAMRMNDD
jgi:membrane protease YdiL (CAAX protease family)